MLLVTTPTHTKFQTPLPATIDDIMKTDQKEEELLPTPLFLRRNNKESLMKHESQDSTYSTGSSNCNTTTNSSNSNISHSSRISSGGYEEDQGSIFCSSSIRSHPSPTSTPHHSHSVSSASPDIQLGTGHPQSYFDDFDHPDSIILQGLNPSAYTNNIQPILGAGPTSTSSQRIPGSSHSHQQTTFNFENSGRKQIPSPLQPQNNPPGRQQLQQSMSMNFGRNSTTTPSSWESHWRSTVLVHHPPKKRHSYEPLALTSTHRNTTTFTSSSAAGGTDSGNELLDSPSQEENPLMQSLSAGAREIRDHTHQTAQYYNRSHQKKTTTNKNT
jgi:hypothetical protein